MTELRKLKVGSEEEFDINIKVKTYSPAVMGYRVILENETYYILNSILSKKDKRKVAEMLLDLGPEYEQYGLIILQEGFKLYANEDYIYDHKVHKHTYETDTVSNIEIYRKYKNYMKKKGYKK